MRTAIVLLLLTGVASAQPALERPALDAHGYLTVDGAATLDRGDISFGLGSLDWAHTQAMSTDAMTATLTGAIGLPYGAELAVTQPISVISGTGPGAGGQGTGDLGLHAKLSLLHGHGMGLSVIGRAYLATATGAMTSAPQAMDQGATELDAVADAHVGPVRFGVDGGMRWRGDLRELPVGAGAAFSISPKLELVSELTGTVGLATAPTQLQAIGGVKLYLAKSSYLMLGAGRGIEEGDTRAFIGIVFEPRPASSTHVEVEAPPSPPEPREPEHVATQDPPAIPDLDLTQIVDSKIEILQPINFEFDKAVITPDSFPVLDAVAKSMTDNPDILRVEVGGHTDERGDAAYNLDLSDRRAAAVVQYLADHGVAAERLRSRGYGKTQPIDPSHTEAAWAKNRRVEFVILGR